MAGKQTLARLDDEFDRYESMLRIDKHALDDELIEQPQYYSDVSQRLATCISYRDEAKDHLEGIRAMCDQRVRSSFADDAKKPPEAAIASMVVQQPEYQQAKDGLAAWHDRYNRWMGLKEAITQRGYALKDLVALFVADYFARNSAGKSVESRERTAKAEAVKEELRNQRKQRTRL
jgi:hypothetical protein